ncbi:MAG TPA: FtsQ-type POTRA domain-containing protein [Acidimicrobiales bacterium]|nr:FtsQ-type POTRA domain-containing protein [Acidimicrobiales bacterium]
MIDPRIRARRIEVARHEGRRRLRRAGLAAAALGVVAMLWGLALSPLLDVDALEVKGARQTGADEVRAASDISPGEAMVTLDTARAAARVRALPWVADARVMRDWPGTVRVEVVERRAVAALAGESDWMLIDAEGHQLARVADVPRGITRIEGVGVAGEVGDLLGAPAAGALRVASMLSGALRPDVLAVVADDEGALTAKVAIAGGERSALALLGPPEALEAKLLALEAVLAGANLEGVATIDVRVPTSPALTRTTEGG